LPLYEDRSLSKSYLISSDFQWSSSLFLNALRETAQTTELGKEFYMWTTLLTKKYFLESNLHRNTFNLKSFRAQKSQTNILQAQLSYKLLRILNTKIISPLNLRYRRVGMLMPTLLWAREFQLLSTKHLQCQHTIRQS